MVIECLTNKVYRVKLQMDQKYIVILLGKKLENHCPLCVRDVFFIHIDDFNKTIHRSQLLVIIWRPVNWSL
jgi:hypothetical protein